MKSDHSVKHKAFTLAEVLITVGIIGVVAALTLPALIEKHRRVELQSALKVAYSLLQQGLERMNADWGYPLTPQDFGYRTFKSAYIEYFDNPVDCNWGGRHSTTNEILCSTGAYTTSNESTYEASDTYKIYNNKSGIAMESNYIDDGQFALKNGMLVMIENEISGRLFISVDINGVGKSPNAWGHDVFTFQLMDDGKLTPMGAPDTFYPVDSYPSYCSKSSTNVNNGLNCTYKAFTDDSFWDGI